jgi:hypothetical protein
MVVWSDLIKMLLRSLLSFKFLDKHTSHLHAIMGTPLLVPVPKNSIDCAKLGSLIVKED